MTAVLDKPPLHKQYASSTAMSSRGMSNRTSLLPSCAMDHLTEIKKPRASAGQSQLTGGRSLLMSVGGKSCGLGLLVGSQERDKFKLPARCLNQFQSQLYRRTPAPAGDLSEIFERCPCRFGNLFGLVSATFFKISFSIHPQNNSKMLSVMQEHFAHRANLQFAI